MEVPVEFSVGVLPYGCDFWPSASDKHGWGFSDRGLGAFTIMSEQTPPPVPWFMRFREGWLPWLYLACLILSNFLREITDFMCSFPSRHWIYINVNTRRPKDIYLSQYHLKIIVYHTLGKDHLGEEASRKDSDETGKIGFQLKPRALGGLRRAVSRQTLEGPSGPRALAQSSGAWPWVGRCYLKERAAFIYPFLCSFCFSFIQIPTMCQVLGWVLGRKSSWSRKETKNINDYSWVSKYEDGHGQRELWEKASEWTFNSMWTTQGSLLKGVMSESSLEV